MKVELLGEGEDLLARALEVSHSRGSFRTPAYAINAFDIDRKLLNEEDLPGVIEILKVFRPEQLENLSSDISLQEKYEYYMINYMRRIPSNQLVIAIPLLEGGQGYTFSYDEISKYSDFITELMVNHRVDLICTPAFSRIPEDHIPIFIEKFLEAMASYSKNVALTIPYASRETRVKVAETYLKWAGKNNIALLNFLCIDYNGSNPITKYSYHNYVLRYVQLLEREVGEPIVMYGVNVKYSRVSKKYDELPARDLASYFAQVDIYGSNHKRRPIPGEVAEKLGAEESAKKQKLLNRNRYTYVSLDKIHKDPSLKPPDINAEIIEQLLKAPRNTSRFERLVKLINIKTTIEEAKILRKLFSSGEYGPFKTPLQYLKSKEVVRIDDILLQRLNMFNRIYKPRTKSLYEYSSK